MKNINKLLSLFLALIFVITSFCTSVVFATNQEKKLVFDAGIDYSGVQGQNNWYYNNGFFNPKDSASRSEAAKIIALCVK